MVLLFLVSLFHSCLSYVSSSFSPFSRMPFATLSFHRNFRLPLCHFHAIKCCSLASVFILTHSVSVHLLFSRCCFSLSSLSLSFSPSSPIVLSLHRRLSLLTVHLVSIFPSRGRGSASVCHPLWSHYLYRSLPPQHALLSPSPLLEVVRLADCLSLPILPLSV